MNKDFDFFVTEMPDGRKADYSLGCLDSSVFIDFNRSDDNRIYLVRISFDGYGCDELGKVVNYLNFEDSQRFIEEVQKKKFDQDALTTLVKEIIKINQEHLWSDALKEYGLI